MSLKAIWGIMFDADFNTERIRIVCGFYNIPHPERLTVTTIKNYKVAGYSWLPVTEPQDIENFKVLDSLHSQWHYERLSNV